MAYSEGLADRIRQVLNILKVSYEEKKMIGGLTFMVNNKMCVGIVKENLMARVGKAFYQDALAYDGVKLMDFNGKPLKGYVYVTPGAMDMDDQLTFWIKKSLEFNKTLVG